jgi:ABC-type Fe3+/spermidine/putrescine transport system ATPase subunit
VVADFMGLINLLPATVIARESGRGRLETAAGWTMTIDVPATAAPGQRVEIGIRPENIRLERQTDTGHGHQAATVTECTFLGSTMEYHVTLEDGALLRVQAHPLEQLAIGDKVAVHIDTSQCTVFEAPAAGAHESQRGEA